MRRRETGEEPGGVELESVPRGAPLAKEDEVRAAEPTTIKVQFRLSGLPVVIFDVNLEVILTERSWVLRLPLETRRTRQ